MDLLLPQKIILYDGIEKDWFSIDKIAGYINKFIPKLEICIRNDLLRDYLNSITDKKGREEEEQKLAYRFSRIRITNPFKQSHYHKPLKPEIDYEKRIINKESLITTGVIYDGNDLQREVFLLIPKEERPMNFIHIWFTERLFATWEENNHRYHARSSIYGYPNIISSSGMVIAPAKDRDFYFKKKIKGFTEEATSYLDKDHYLKLEDVRITEVSKGYVMQALFFIMTGEAFCEEKNCRLYNAHWQKELYQAQLSGKDFCLQHKDLLEKINLGG